MRRYRRNQDFPPDILPATGEGPKEATDQGDATDSHVEGSPVVESGEQFTTYIKPLVEHPPMADTSFHAPIEDLVDSPTKCGPNAPF